MNLIDEVANLKELEAKATPIGWIKSIKAEYEEDGPTGHDEYNIDEGIVRADGDGWGQIVCRPDLERDADFIADTRNAAPKLLDVLGEIRAGDERLLQRMITIFGQSAWQDEYKAEVDCLRRYRDMAKKMEANR